MSEPSLRSVHVPVRMGVAFASGLVLLTIAVAASVMGAGMTVPWLVGGGGLMLGVGIAFEIDGWIVRQARHGRKDFVGQVFIVVALAAAMVLLAAFTLFSRFA